VNWVTYVADRRHHCRDTSVEIQTSINHMIISSTTARSTHRRQRQTARLKTWLVVDVTFRRSVSVSCQDWASEEEEEEEEEDVWLKQ